MLAICINEYNTSFSLFFYENIIAQSISDM
jgi:hypothetical protein